MNREHRTYIGLAALFIIAVLLQGWSAWDHMDKFRHETERARHPFSFERTDPPVITTVSPEAMRAGVQKGDRLLAVNDRPFAGRAQWDEAFENARPGAWLIISVLHPDSERPSEARRLTIELAPQRQKPASAGEWLTVIVMNVAMPFFCLGLGFWVAALRPRDPLAWILLGLLLSFAHAGWLSLAGGGWLRDSAITFHMIAEGSWSIWMLLFGLYFPEPADLERRWPWAKWIFLAPLIFFLITDVIVEVGSLESFAAIAPLQRWVRPYETAVLILRMLAISVFFYTLGSRLGVVSQPDARRRLILLNWGASISLTPMFLIVVRGLIRGVDPFTNMPAWLLIPAFLMLSLFPLVLAYVIVVQRALDVRVVIRQGVQYAFARHGVLVLRFLLSAAIFYEMLLLVNRSQGQWALNLGIIAVSVALFFLVRGAGERLAQWIDRRFFREAYNAEQILSDLSEQVRMMAEAGPIMHMVAQRIAQSLHVPRVALLTQTNGQYRPAHALGFNGVPAIAFSERGGTATQLRQTGAPLRVYFDDQSSWIYRAEGLSDEERAMLKALNTQLVLPLAVKEKLLGFISLGPKQSEEPYSRSDLRLLQAVAAQTGLALENSRLTAAIAAEVAQRERINRELEIAREVQERLFPQDHPTVPGLDYAGACRPALGVGGDYYDFLSLPSGVFGIAIGDVSGKGISAALLMASLQASLRGQTIQGAAELDTLMSNVNRLVYDASAANRYATFFYAQYQPATRRLIYVNAGHNPPIVLRRANGGAYEVLRLDVGGVVAGLLRDVSYQQGTLILEPGDLLLAFTDGISEAMNPADEEWGEARLIEAAGASAGLNAADMLARIFSAADAFAAGAPQHDDMTLVVARVLQ